ncbi:MAG: helix-turn-helix domain-containing protein [Candidatus Thorarchaeota archaeon]
MAINCIIEISSEHYYSCKLTRMIPVRVSIVTINGDTGFGIIESLKHEERSIQQYVDELSKSESIKSVTVTHKAPQAYWTRVVHKVEGPSIYETILQSGCMTYLPIVVENGIQTHVVLAPSREVLSNMLHMLRDRFSFVRIKRIRPTPSGLLDIDLTSKQRDAIDLAVESGYYNIPRKCTIEELGEKLGIKRVAMQERLRRAEQRVIAFYARK